MKIDSPKLNAPIYSIALTLWSAAVFFSYLSARFDFTKIGFFYFFSSLLPLIAAVIFIFLKEKTIFSAVLLFGSFVISFGLDLPLVPNHRYVLFFSSILLMLPIFLSPKNQETYFISQTVRQVRALTVIVYVFAFFSKLNWDYLDLKKSCAIVFFRHIQDLNSFLPHLGIIDLGVVYGSLMIELAIPFFLLLRFTHLALVVGILFHFILALDIYKYFTNFSAVMALLLFVSAGQGALGIFQKSSELVVKKIFKSKTNFNLLLLGWLVMLLSSSILVDFSGGILESKAILLFITFRHLLWLGFGLFLLFTTFMLFLDSNILSRDTPNIEPRRYSVVALVVLLLAFLNGMTPFLGLKSRTGFNMYGNMRIEPNFSNHLLLPRTFGIRSLMEDSGIVLAAESEMVCNKVLYPKTEYPIFEILRAVKSCPEENFKFEYGGTVLDSQSKEVNLLIAQKTSVFTRKLLTFKPLGLRAESECIW